MTIVTVTGNLFDHAGRVLPDDCRPELFFTAEGPQAVEGDALVGVEVPATLSATTGAFTVRLKAYPGVRYRMRARWLVNPGDPPERWARQYAEWPQLVDPYPIGGKLTDLLDPVRDPRMVRVSLAHPEPSYRGLWLEAAPGDPNDPAAVGSGMLRLIIDA